MTSTVHTDPNEIENVGLDLDLLRFNCRVLAERLDDARYHPYSDGQVALAESDARRDIADLRDIARCLAEETEDLGHRQTAREIASEFDELDRAILATQRHNA